MQPREIVYLSLGTPSNYVAAHFWNTQQAYFDYRPDAPAPLVEHDVSFKAGVGTDGYETYTPRAMLFDVREEFGHLRRVNEMYDTGDEPIEGWEHEIVRTQEAPQDKNRRFWTDVAETPFHPKSLIPVAAPSMYGHSHMSNMGTDTKNPTLDTFSQGEAVARAMDKEQGVMDDTLRWWTEDADLLQGFQLTATNYDAYSGMACAYLDMLEDEYPKMERHLILLSQHVVDTSAPWSRFASMNRVLSLVHALEHAHITTPVTLSAPPHWPHVHVDSASLSDTSAIVATLLESATLPQRLHSRPGSMNTLRTRLQWRGNTPLAQLGGCIPTPLMAAERARADPTDALIDAMLARYSKRVSHSQPQSFAPQAAQRLRNAWWDATLCTLAKDAGVPYAECIVARDADAQAEHPTMQALTHEYPLSEPLVARYVARLTKKNICTACVPNNGRVPQRVSRPHVRWTSMAKRRRTCRLVPMRRLVSHVARHAAYHQTSAHNSHRRAAWPRATWCIRHRRSRARYSHRYARDARVAV